ncbi:NAD(P)-dependent alcohol dehydrogenase [Photobacterium alginatilyticum]|uniref:NAD(P)-dependent alcohol dehydrogenase n=1 Tax=Photobacterium alginatilyticum TaxID=1775171 RepID=A0ABW9YEW1_9GAMM|nr:NAD(P)-dependent alcohol dehydrogenase [Photobacterium alginatilyticum]NBI51970.1 NAD(P)-dependent alcohol dehydrogenase [Photobacterium alginatilyticum]
MCNEKFNAYAVMEAGGKLVPWSYSPEAMGDWDIDVKITHNGVCHTDLHMRDDDWDISQFPLVAGHEVVGEIVETGKLVKNLNIGDRVGLGWIRDSCRSCDHCLSGQENICREGYTGLIVGHHGGFADKVRVPADFAYRIPDGLSSAAAAPLLCAGITVYTPLRTHIDKLGMKVGVMGIGGLGHLALQYANAMGAEVTAFSTTKSKEEEARSFGAHNFLQWGNEDEMAEAKGTFDLIVCTISADADWNMAFDLLANNGKLCFVGLPVSEMKVPLLPLIFGQKSVVGSIVGGRHFMQEMLNFSAVHGIEPQIEVMPINKINEAMDKVAANKARYRIVLETA